MCTQPRRVAAISVAERVAEEWGEEYVGKLIGYQIRMEIKRNSETRILFCTTGVILRRLMEDKELTGISHVVVDEVHERQVRCGVLHWQIQCARINIFAGTYALADLSSFIVANRHPVSSITFIGQWTPSRFEDYIGKI